VALRLKRTPNPVTPNRNVNPLSTHLSIARISKGRHASLVAVTKMAATVVKSGRKRWHTSGLGSKDDVQQSDLGFSLEAKPFCSDEERKQKTVSSFVCWLQ